MNAKFQIQQFVTITVHGLNYHGRVHKIIFDGGPQTVYSVIYVSEGNINCAEFYEDEISGQS